MKKLVPILLGIWAAVIGICSIVFFASIILDFLVWIGVDSVVAIDTAINEYCMSKGSLIFPLDFVDLWSWSNVWKMCLTVAFFIPLVIGVASIKRFSDLEKDQIRNVIAISFSAIFVGQIVLVSAGYWEVSTIVKYMNLAMGLTILSLDQILDADSYEG